MTAEFWGWIIFTVFLIVMLSLDLFIFHRNAHVVRVKESLIWSFIWIMLAFIFGIGIYYSMGIESSLNFYAGYLLEKSLSVDNLFIFLVIFSYFNPPPHTQHKILFWGILGAIATRLIFIFAGIALVSQLHWILYFFGFFLLYLAFKLCIEKEEKIEPEKNKMLQFIRRFIPISDQYHDEQFFIKKEGRWIATPLFAILIIIESTDIIFAMDSIPAIFAITLDPFIVFTSNIFAILGLRSLFFALSGIMQLFHYLHYGLAIILGSIGVKILIADFIKIPVIYTLLFIITVLILTIVASIVFPNKNETNPSSEK